MVLKTKWFVSLLCASSAIIFALPVSAKWVKVGTTGNGETYYFENTKITRINDSIRYQYKTVLPREDYSGVKSVRFQMEGDCLLKQTRSLEAIAYNARGKKVGHQVYQGTNEQPKRIVLSGSQEEYLLQQVCAIR